MTAHDWELTEDDDVAGSFTVELCRLCGVRAAVFPGGVWPNSGGRGEYRYQLGASAQGERSPPCPDSCEESAVLAVHGS